MARRIGENSNLKLYKFIPFKYLKRIVENGNMPIKRIDGWEDCYENYFLKNRFVVGVEQYDLKKISRRFYGLCFSTLPESDALWRIYSDVSGLITGRADALDNVAIRVRVSPRQLYQMVPVRVDVSGVSNVQRVEYKTKDEIEKAINAANPYTLDTLTYSIRDSFYTKRLEFSHEKEARYVFVTNRYHKSNTIEMSLNPLAFFEEFTVDPRLNRNQYVAVRRELEMLRIPAARINQSELYHFDQKTLTITP